MSKRGDSTAARGEWGSKLGFILAAAGSAVGLGNIWKFPYITGENGGGLFVLIYLACIIVIGLPVMIAEVLVGRHAQRSPVGAFRSVKGASNAWSVVGWMGVVAGFVILSYYSVVAGWTLHYLKHALTSDFTGQSAEQIGKAFGELYAAPGPNIGWHAVFIVATVLIVMGGVAKGIEAASRILMPLLFLMMGVLLVDAFAQEGFGAAAKFLFAPNTAKISPAGVLEALGHSFFTLSVGMGAMLTYGSYMRRDRDIVSSSMLVALLDTAVALMACLILFPITFSFGMKAEAGPGLVFANMPVAFSQMPFGNALMALFFLLLFFAALSSGISLLEVVVSTMIDEFKWPRKRAVVLMGGLIFFFGIPSALSGSKVGIGWWENLFPKNFFDSMDYLASNWLLPLGGLFIALFVGWGMPDDVRRKEFSEGSSYGALYGAWLFALKYVVPVAIFALWLVASGIFPKEWLAAG